MADVMYPNLCSGNDPRFDVDWVCEENPDPYMASQGCAAEQELDEVRQLCSHGSAFAIGVRSAHDSPSAHMQCL